MKKETDKLPQNEALNIAVVMHRFYDFSSFDIMAIDIVIKQTQMDMPICVNEEDKRNVINEAFVRILEIISNGA